jgi:hypothetical protein
VTLIVTVTVTPAHFDRHSDIDRDRDGSCDRDCDRDLECDTRPQIPSFHNQSLIPRNLIQSSIFEPCSRSGLKFFQNEAYAYYKDSIINDVFAVRQCHICVLEARRSA